MATYNGEKFIKYQIESILSQLNSKDELIISDNFSDDLSLKIIEEFNDDRIKLVFCGKNEGKIKSINRNFQNALNHSSGDKILLSDQDDIWLPSKLNLFDEYLEKFNCVLSDCTIVDSELNIINESYFSIRPPSNSVLNVIYKNPFLGCCMGFNRTLIEDFNEIPSSNYIGHDIWIGINSLFNNELGIIDKPLILYRKHETSASSSGNKSSNSIFYKINYRIILIINLFKWRIKSFFK